MEMSVAEAVKRDRAGLRWRARRGVWDGSAPAPCKERGAEWRGAPARGGGHGEQGRMECAAGPLASALGRSGYSRMVAQLTV